MKRAQNAWKVKKWTALRIDIGEIALQMCICIPGHAGVRGNEFAVWLARKDTMKRGYQESQWGKRFLNGHKVRGYYQIVWTSGQKKGRERRALFRKSKKNSEPTQNWFWESLWVADPDVGRLCQPP
jgi:hypothetical protein